MTDMCLDGIWCKSMSKIAVASFSGIDVAFGQAQLLPIGEDKVRVHTVPSVLE